MKKEKGFTLIEVLAVVIIIGILLLLVVPNVYRYLKRGTDEYYKNLENTVSLSGKDYFNDYRALLPKYINNVAVLTLEELVENKYIDPVVDSEGETCTGKVVAKNTGKNSYEYYSCLVCENYKTEGEACEYDENENITPESEDYEVRIEDTGDYEIDASGVYIVDQGEEFVLPYGKAYYKGELVNDKVKPKPNMIDTNKLGEVKVTYVYQGAKAEILVRVVDRVKPSIPQIVLRKENNKGKKYTGDWYSGNIYEEYNSTDYSKPGVMGSGIAYYEISKDNKNFTKLDSNYQIDTKNGTYTYYVRAVDKSGNVGDSNTYQLKIDKEIPSCALEVKSGTVGNGGWYTSNVTIGFKNVTETVSALGSQTIDKPSITSSTKETTITGTVIDLAGNKNSCSIKVKMDKVTPSAPTITASDNIGSGNWHAEAFTLSYSGANNVSGNTYYYGTTNNPTTPGSSTQISGDTTGTTYYAKVCSGAGLCSTNSSYLVKLDTVAPTCTLKVIKGPLGNNGWYTDDVEVGFGSTDGTVSNIKISSIDKTSITSEGTTKVTGNVTDEAGRVGACSISVQIDKTAPKCEWSGENKIWTNQPVNIKETCNDTVSKCKKEVLFSKTYEGEIEVKSVAFNDNVCDNAGNCSICKASLDVYYDGKAPAKPTSGTLYMTGITLGNLSNTGSDPYFEIRDMDYKKDGKDEGSGFDEFLYLITPSTNYNEENLPKNNHNSFINLTTHNMSCGKTYNAYVIAVDKVGNRSPVHWVGKIEVPKKDGSWSTCKDGIETRTDNCPLFNGQTRSCGSSCDYSPQQKWDFEYEYEENSEKFTIPCSGIYRLQVWGAKGGTSKGGEGGYTEASFWFKKNTILYVVVGSQPNIELGNNAGGYNGGGNGASNGDKRGGGGGATHIALRDGTIADIGYDEFVVKNKGLIVAGGGGGGTYQAGATKTSAKGGSGGGGCQGDCNGSHGLNGEMSNAGAGNDGKEPSLCSNKISNNCFKNLAAGGETLLDKNGYFTTVGGSGGIGVDIEGNTYEGNPGIFGHGGNGTNWQPGGGGGLFGGGAAGVAGTYTSGGGGGSGFINIYLRETSENVIFVKDSNNGHIGGNTNNGRAIITLKQIQDSYSEN